MGKKTLITVFNTPHEAFDVIRRFDASGIDREDVSLLTLDSAYDSSAMGDKVASQSEMDNFGRFEHRTLSGIGPVRMLGPITSHISENNPEGLVDALEDFGAPEKDAHIFAESLRRGNTLLAVDAADDRIDEIAALLERHGAIDIDQRSEAYKKSGFDRFDASQKPFTKDEVMADRERYGSSGDIAIPVIEETAHVEKRKIDEGRIRVITRVTETPVEEQVRLHDEHYSIDRHPVDRPLNADDMSTFKEGEIELSESREEAVLSKEARVKEEVVIHKDVDERTETVSGTTRRSDVRIEKDDPNLRR